VLIPFAFSLRGSQAAGLSVYLSSELKRAKQAMAVCITKDPERKDFLMEHISLYLSLR
jgi:hypothetical protein